MPASSIRTGLRTTGVSYANVLLSDMAIQRYYETDKSEFCADMAAYRRLYCSATTTGINLKLGMLVGHILGALNYLFYLAILFPTPRLA